MLVDAGVRTAQLMIAANYADDTTTAAVRRLETIIIKLRVLAGEDPVCSRAVREFEEQLARHQREVKREQGEGAGAAIVLLVLVVALIAGVVLLIRWLMR